MRILVTGAAGFIGYHLARKLCGFGHDVVGIDNINAYYDVGIKYARLESLKKFPNFVFFELDFSKSEKTVSFFAKDKTPYDIVVHLGAQAGVRYSIDNPLAYTESNITGTLNILEGCRASGTKSLIYASSSSVYGANKKLPFSVDDRVDEPVSLYAATKKANELMCYTYSHLYGIKAIGLRFFTVYGPFGRPDMAYFKFTKALYNGSPIDVYNSGDMSRDFTYIDDIVNAIESMISGFSGSSENGVFHKVYNLGNNRPERLMDMIQILEQLTDRKASMRMLPMQPGDVNATYADISDARRDFGFSPKTSLKDGLTQFVEWYKSYYKVN